MAQDVVIDEVVRTPDKKLLNREWIILHNRGAVPLNTEGCSITVGRVGTSHPRVVTTLKAGLVVAPGEQVRLVSGSSGKTSQGEPPAEAQGIRNYYLFLKAPYVDRDGLEVRLMHGQHEVCRHPSA